MIVDKISLLGIISGMDSHKRKITRRQFLTLVASAGAVALVAAFEGKGPSSPTPSLGSPRFNTNITYAGNGYVSFYKGPPVPLAAAAYDNLPRWHGFNLQEKFTLKGDRPYQEFDFDAIATWGFNFVRLPTDYHIWTPQPYTYLEKPLKEIDQAIQWGRERQIHVNLCLHRAPGYCVNPPAEPLNLWIDGSIGEEARKQFADQWRMFAARYRGIPPAELSFNLVNEPDNSVLTPHYVRAMQAAITAIRAEDPHRLIITDGLKSSNQPVPELNSLQVAQSTHFYKPSQLTSYKASWIKNSSLWPVPTWPLVTPDRHQCVFIRGHLTRPAKPAGAEGQFCQRQPGHRPRGHGLQRGRAANQSRWQSDLRSNLCAGAGIRRLEKVDFSPGMEYLHGFIRPRLLDNPAGRYLHDRDRIGQRGLDVVYRD